MLEGINMKRISLILTFILLSGIPLSAQQNPEQKGGLIAVARGRVDERGSARFLYRTTEDEDVRLNGFLGELAINYGRPVWKAEYADPATFDQMTQGQVWRMGDNFWTVLDTNRPVKISGKEIAVGAYYLGIHRSEDGSTWSLAFIDPVKARRDQIDPLVIRKAPIDFMVPMTFSRVEEPAEKLTITLEHEGGGPPTLEHERGGPPLDVTFRLVWGIFQLTAPVQMMGLE